MCASEAALPGRSAQKVVFGFIVSMASPDQDSIQSTSVCWPAVLVKLRQVTFSCTLRKSQGGKGAGLGPTMGYNWPGL